MTFRALAIACCMFALAAPTLAQSGAATDSITGTWTGEFVIEGAPKPMPMQFQLKANGKGVVTGTFTELFFGTGRIDPAQPGRIDADGRVEMRFKLAVFSDFTFRGQMDSTGRRITGGVFGSGFNGESFVMNKQ